jgi:hypothetical protein
MRESVNHLNNTALLCEVARLEATMLGARSEGVGGIHESIRVAVV